MLKILSCNIRDARAADGANNWPRRRALCVDIIRAQAPDIIGFQEMRKIQLDDMAAAFPDYAYYGLSEQLNGDDCPNAIFFRRARFRAMASGGYWLSTTPTIAGSKSWGSASVRLLNWVTLQEDVSQKVVRILNTHLDDGSAAARRHQAQIIIADANAWPADAPQVLLGDMNCGRASPVLQYFLAAGWRDTDDVALPRSNKPGSNKPSNADRLSRGTYHAFQGDAYFATATGEEAEKIDWILVRGTLAVTGAAIIRNSVAGRYPSDHYFLSACVEL